MAEPGLPPSLDAGPALADWRDQLRDRVKEIRARKMADGRKNVETRIADPTVEPRDAAAAERLRAVRAEVAEVEADADFTPELPTLESLPQEPQSQEPLPQAPLPTPSEATVLPAAAGEMELTSTLEPPPADAEVPLFQREAEVLEESPPTMSLDSDFDPDASPLDANALKRVLADLESQTRREADGAEISSALPDLSSIPEEMQDLEIPAWALPRQPQPAAETTETAEMAEVPEMAAVADPAITAEQGPMSGQDFHMVAEFASASTTPQHAAPAAQTGVDDDLFEDVTLDPGTPIGDLAAATPAAPAKPLGDSLRGGNPFPGLFDPADALVEQPGNTSKRAPGVVDAEWANSALPSELATSATDAPFDNEPRTPVDTSLPVTTPVDVASQTLRGLDDTAAAATPEEEKLEWDLDAPVDESTPPGAPAGRLDPSAPVSDRIFSALADGLVLMTIGVVLSVAGASAAATPVLPFLQATPVPFALAWLLFALVYGVFFVGTCGQTLGKMVMRVRVIGADRFQVGYAKATLRALWYTLAAVPAFLGFVAVFSDPEHRALHDRLSGTKVVKA